jgi:predicted GNAT superfamily acetyltransferase
MSRRKRGAEQLSTTGTSAVPQDMEELEEALPDPKERLKTIDLKALYHQQGYKLSTTEKEDERFSHLSEEAQQACIKAIYRLFLFKGNQAMITIIFFF